MLDTPERRSSRRGRWAVCMLLLPALLFMTCTFLAPLAKLLELSFSDSRGTFAAYTEILRRVNDEQRYTMECLRRLIEPRQEGGHV